jgi:phosphohistidine phosphatase
LRQRDELALFFESKSAIENVWCSSAARTRETLTTLPVKTDPIFFDDFYLCSYQTMLKELWGRDLKGEVLLVGHNFGISDLLNYFCDSDLELRTGEYVCISFDCDKWKETFRGTGTIVQQYRPEV